LIIGGLPQLKTPRGKHFFFLTVRSKYFNVTIRIPYVTFKNPPKLRAGLASISILKPLVGTICIKTTHAPMFYQYYQSSSTFRQCYRSYKQLKQTNTTFHPLPKSLLISWTPALDPICSPVIQPPSLVFDHLTFQFMPLLTSNTIKSKPLCSF